jgi:long-chain acyl-CoA synthetase
MTQTLSSTFFGIADRTPARTALICDTREMTYQELASLVRRWSNAMAANGVARGDMMAVILPNATEFVALMMVAADLGAVLVPLSTSLPPADVFTSFAATDVKHVVSTGAFLQALLDASGSSADAVTGLWLSVDKGVAPRSAARVRVLPELLSAVNPTLGPLNEGTDDDPLILSMTSGSTGDPKPIILTQRTKINRVLAAVELYGVTEHDKTLAATPLYHSLAERLVLMPLLTGGTSILMPRFSARSWLQCVRERAVTFTVAVSSQLKQIAAELDASRSADIASLRCVVSSSALLDLPTKTALMTKLHCAFHECYGASEIAIASNLDDHASRIKTQSVGRAAPGVDIRIIGKNDEILANGQPGEIICRTPMLFGGYYRRPDLTRRAMFGEYFRTGDTGVLDDEGFLHFLGRSKDIIISGGMNIYPPDIETVVNQHPSVRESAAFAFADERLGEVVAVALVPADDAAFDLKMLRFHCCEHLADFQQPHKFFLMPALPKNAMGKLMKFRLVQMFSTAASASREGTVNHEK